MAKKQSTPSSSSGDAQAFGHAVGDAFKAMAALNLPLQDLARLQQNYLQEVSSLWNQALGASSEAAPIKDRRFASQAWAQNPMAAFTARAYLLNARTLMEMAEAVEGDAKTKARVRFAVQQWIDAASPANFLALNPEAQQKALDTQGQSIARGLEQLLADIRQGHMSQTDEAVFEVGRNVATTEGSVVFENDLMQLIEYKPLTAQVHEKPMLFVPPCINKYYILDLQPDNSVIRYTVEQGHRLFVVSWRNPDESLAHKSWDDYIAEGPLKAIEVVQAITGQDQFNMLGFCVGGTILTTALAVLAARGQQPASSVTLLTTLLDFSNTGILDIFVDEPMVQMREMTIGADAPSGPSLLKGGELAATFSFLRPNDLVWNYVVGNYLKGETPPPFDLLYWNSDSTNLPGPMYCWYLRHLYLQNELRIPGRLSTCGEAVDVGAIKAPFYLYASREDHIVPWDAAYRSTQMIKGKKRFVMGASGHIAGVINPPAKGKRHFWTNDRLVDQADDWLSAATEHPGSWWTDWSKWLATHGGKKVAAPKAPGNRQYRAIEPAPGRYVKQKT
ncbi:MAG: class I poly(R)-hydroxyalkanoic acid synthase [Betaproteobacteria bacterium]|nr:class I poly(R)-hydroxyalkanoic acid synthase [Betaproteobacteria bacterium]NBT10938.1 class I poly(R)-hydroxyalkanoic acid synthase [Betaproteobacteria bacterium]NBU48938.1 class I poly(R)-hydroxyalkanoic acid synthase [Betaproteobacteria bacterium]